jgi:hypothetical protein
MKEFNLGVCYAKKMAQWAMARDGQGVEPV